MQAVRSQLQTVAGSGGKEKDCSDGQRPSAKRERKKQTNKTDRTSIKGK